MDPLSTANADFCLDVFKELNRHNVGENIFFSPLSLLYALSMVLLGARGNSAGQMEKVWNAVEISTDLSRVLCTCLGQPDTRILIPRKFCHLVTEETHLGKSYFLE